MILLIILTITSSQNLSQVSAFSKTIEAVKTIGKAVGEESVKKVKFAQKIVQEAAKVVIDKGKKVEMGEAKKLYREPKSLE